MTEEKQAETNTIQSLQNITGKNALALEIEPPENLGDFMDMLAKRSDLLVYRYTSDRQRIDSGPRKDPAGLGLDELSLDQIADLPEDQKAEITKELLSARDRAVGSLFEEAAKKAGPFTLNELDTHHRYLFDAITLLLETGSFDYWIYAHTIKEPELSGTNYLYPLTDVHTHISSILNGQYMDATRPR